MISVETGSQVLCSRECVRNLYLWVQVHPGELWVSRSAGAHSTRSFKISGCKRWYPKDLQVRAPAAPALTHSLDIIEKPEVTNVLSCLFPFFFPFSKFMYGRSRKKLTLRPHNNKDNAGVIKVDTNSFASFILTSRIELICILSV